MHINGAQALLKLQYPEIGGLQSTPYQQSEHPLSHPDNAVQIIHVQPQHWAVISTKGCPDGTVELYDSVYNTCNFLFN